MRHKAVIRSLAVSAVASLLGFHQSATAKEPLTREPTQVALAPERPEPPKKEARDAEAAATLRGKVKSFHENPKGVADGLTLEDGTEVRFPPHLGDRVAEIISVSDEVSIVGRKHTGPKGDSHVRAESISNVRSKRSVDASASPANKGPGRAEPKPAPAHEQILVEVRAIRAIIEGKAKKGATKEHKGLPHEQVLRELRDLRELVERKMPRKPD